MAVPTLAELRAKQTGAAPALPTLASLRGAAPAGKPITLDTLDQVPGLDSPAPVAQPQAPASYALSEVPGTALSNIPASGARLAGGIMSMVSHPLDTAGTLAQAAGGAIYNTVPPARAITALLGNPEYLMQAVGVADAIGGVYRDRYGTVEGIKRTVAEDPVGAAADLSMLLSGGAGALRATGTAAGTANALSTAARVTNPLTYLMAPIEATGRAAAGGARAVANALNPKAAAYVASVEGRGGEVLNALRDPNLEMVQGSLPTAAQAAAGTGITKFVSLGDEGEKVLPTEYLARGMAQDQARIAAVQTVGKDKPALAAAEAGRAAATKPLYKALEQERHAADPVLQGLLDTPAGRSALRVALRAEANRQRPGLLQAADPVAGTPAVYSGAVLDEVAKALKTQATAPSTASTSARSGAQSAGEVRTKVVSWLEQNSPSYKAARDTHRTESGPINRMQVGQFLEGKLVPALGPEAMNMRSGTFAGAVRDAPGTIKNAATQAPRYDDLGKILTPDEMKIINGIKDDLAREAETKRVAAAARNTTPRLKTVASGAMPISGVHLLSRVATVANQIFTRLRGRLDERLSIQIATEMLDPALAAKALEKALARESSIQAAARIPKAAGKAVNTLGRAPGVGSAGNALSLRQD